METDKYGLVRKYFQLDQSIEEAQKRIQTMRKEFYTQSMHTRMESSLDGSTFTRGFRQETEVVLFVDCVAHIERNITKNRKRQRYLRDYLHTLPPDSRNYLFKRYVEQLHVSVRESVETALIEEINEIEDAIHFMYGHEPEPREADMTGNRKADFQQALMVLGVS